MRNRPTKDTYLQAAGLLGGSALPVLARVALLGRVPLGIDGGVWLASATELLGRGFRPGLYPPVVPLLAYALSGVFGPFMGLSVLAVLAGVAPGLALGMFARRLASPLWVQIAAAFLVSVAGMTAEAVYWGGYPQLLALALFPLALLSVEQSIRGSGSTPWRTALLVAALAATSHLVFASLVAATLVVCLVEALSVTPRHVLRNAIPLSWRTALVLLPLVPVYLSVLETASVSSSAQKEKGVAALFEIRSYLLRSESIGWACVLAIVLAALVASRRFKPVGTTSAFGAFTVSVVLPLVTGERRFAYLFATATAMCVVVAVRAISPAFRRLTSGAVILAVVLVAVPAMLRTSQDAEFYQVVDADAVDLASAAGRLTRPGDRIATASIRTFPFGWWVEGISRRRVLSMAPDAVLYRESERQDAAAALSIFQGTPAEPFPSKMGLSSASNLDVAALVVPWAWGGTDAKSLRERLAVCSCKASVGYENSFGAVVLLENTGR